MVSKTPFLATVILFVSVVTRILADPAACASQESCESCLGADFACAWCTDQTYASTELTSTNRRCLIRTDLLRNGCRSEYILQNAEARATLEDHDLQDYQENGKTIQIRPQKTKVRLVKGRTMEIEMNYRPARNNPLDLYYLMDLTFSMEDDRKTLVSVGNKLAQTLGSLTENYRVGYGSFSDKPIMPMIVPGTEANPCKPAGVNCEPAYDFRHHLSLTNDSNKFVREVNDSRITGNLDNLEGTLDALMQVIVCGEKIGWSENARKIVIIATDGLMHFAGDGLLAGLTKRNDKKCYLDENGLYTAALDFDYPSLEEIYRELQRRKISVIFAVTKGNSQAYRQAVDLMRDVSSVDILSEDSSNIVELVGEGYKKLVRKVHFVDNSPAHIDVTYKTDCGIPGGKLVDGSSCENLDIGQNVKFVIGLKANKFPEDGVYNSVIRVEDVGLSEHLEIEVEIQKPCPCERGNKTELVGRDLCNENGNFECGMCFCDAGWMGKSCSCNTQASTNTDLLNQCRPPLSGTKRGAICSDQGECECGACFCFEGYEGQYCECPKCSDYCNPDRADCKCGSCECRAGWTGIHCDCPTSTQSCIAPNDEICSGEGECKCGRCECNAMFHGPFCEINQNTTEMNNKICQYFNPCVESLVRERKDERVNVIEQCVDSNRMMFGYVFVETLKENFEVCTARVQFQDGLSCDFQYIYDTNQNAKQLYILWDDTCKPVNYTALISFSVVGTILLGVLIFLLMKICILWQEKREFAKFQDQVKKSEWQTTTSPLYERPIRECKMPDDMDGTEFN